jgi:hypothetical protein
VKNERSKLEITRVVDEQNNRINSAQAICRTKQQTVKRNGSALTCEPAELLQLFLS